MQAAPIDPRDIRWEIDEPAYRVYFWDETRGWSSDEWRLSEADVHEVLDWATEHAAGRRTTVWAELGQNGEPGLVRLSGWEPVRTAEPPPWVRQ
jgi:hypothetical protein